MPSPNPIRTNPWGIDLNFATPSYSHDTAPETIQAILQAMGVHASDEFPIPPSLSTATRCWMPANLHTWGWAVQLYGARSNQSWGMGDLADLETLAKWSAQKGAGMLLVNPLSAALPIHRQEASPYYPSSRCLLNPIWLHVEWIPGAAQIPGIAELAATAQALNAQRHIQRDQVYALKMQALRALWSRFAAGPEFTQFCESQGAALETYATFCALAEIHQSGWHSWPENLQHPGSPSVLAFAAAHRPEIDFHKWLQWLLDLQMARCGAHLDLMQDLPIGVNPDGADAWAWQDLLTRGAAIGAPPDEFNTQGQNWGIPPFIPHKLSAAAYAPFIQTVRAAMRHTGGLRIDHVMGLFRLFWIPHGMAGAQGAYVRYNFADLLAIVARESERAKAYVVGEDLGTVEEETRQQLTAHNILSYRLLWFEKEHPKDFPVEALAAITTHDLPTVAGLWSGADLALQKRLGLQPNEASTQEIHQRLSKMAAIRAHDPMPRVIEKAYQLLAESPSRILTAALDDAAAVEERPNLPATTLETNWSTALPMPLEDLMASDLPQKIARALRRRT